MTSILPPPEIAPELWAAFRELQIATENMTAAFQATTLLNIPKTDMRTATAIAILGCKNDLP